MTGRESEWQLILAGSRDTAGIQSALSISAAFDAQPPASGIYRPRNPRVSPLYQMCTTTQR